MAMMHMIRPDQTKSFLGKFRDVRPGPRRLLYPELLQTMALTPAERICEAKLT